MQRRSSIQPYSYCRSFFFQAEDGIRDLTVTGVQTCALPISAPSIWSSTTAMSRREVDTREVRVVIAVVELQIDGAAAEIDRHLEVPLHERETHRDRKSVV